MLDELGFVWDSDDDWSDDDYLEFTSDGTPHGKCSRYPLHSAAEHGNYSIVARWLERGADANAVDSRGRTPLYYAAKNGHRKTAMLLVEHLRRKQDAAVDALCEEMSGLTIADLHQIFVRLVNGENVIVRCSLEDGVEQVKRRLRDRLVMMGSVDMPSGTYYLVRSSGGLNPHKTLLENGVAPEDTLVQQLRLCGGVIDQDDAAFMIEQTIGRMNPEEVTGEFLLSIFRRVCPQWTPTSTSLNGNTDAKSAAPTSTNGKSDTKLVAPTGKPPPPP
eukprot:COSAG03_NODE_4988_length_1371_cov_1.162736_2_plen_274_part_01